MPCPQPARPCPQDIPTVHPADGALSFHSLGHRGQQPEMTFSCSLCKKHKHLNICVHIHQGHPATFPQGQGKKEASPRAGEVPSTVVINSSVRTAQLFSETPAPATLPGHPPGPPSQTQPSSPSCEPPLSLTPHASSSEPESTPRRITDSLPFWDKF